MRLNDMGSRVEPSGMSSQAHGLPSSSAWPSVTDETPEVLFIGSRCHVLDAALALDMRVTKVLAMEASPLHRHAEARGLSCVAVQHRAQALDAIASTRFDLLVSNGCPWILPVSALKKAHQQFVNVHPSLLPNLKGRHPVNGAVLFEQPVGASCHVMDDGIDTGDVIARVHVDADAGADLGLLYRLAFLAEGDAFRRAHARGFRPGSAECQELSEGDLYFSRTPEALAIDFSDPIDTTVRRVAAFSLPGQMARFRFGDRCYLVARAARVASRYLQEKFSAVAPGTVVLKYDDTIVLKMRDGYLRLSGVASSTGGPNADDPLQEGVQLAQPGQPLPQPSATGRRLTPDAP